MLPGELRWFMSEQVHIAGVNNPLVKRLRTWVKSRGFGLYKCNYYYYLILLLLLSRGHGDLCTRIGPSGETVTLLLSIV